MNGIIEIGTISSRGQIAIPAPIRSKLDFQTGSKVIFFADEDILLVRKVTSETFAEITKPFKTAAKKANLHKKDVNRIIHAVRK